MSWLSFFLILFGVSWACIGLFRWYAVEKGMIDEPNERSSHTIPTPRGGGFIFCLLFAGLLSVLYYFQLVSMATFWLLIPAILMGCVGFWDDMKGLSVIPRFFFQCILAAACLYIANENGELIFSYIPYSLILCFSLLVISMVWMVNLYNFMDGSDGLAAMEAIFIFGLGGYFLYASDAYEWATIAWGLMALVLGFLAWNWPKARIFMGDSGSGFLGMCVATFVLISYKYFHIPITIWIILTGLFWFDSTVTLIRRMIAREPFWKAHRSHAYQRLIQARWSHQKVLIGALGVNNVLGGLAYIAFKDPRLLPFSLGVSVSFLACIYILIEIIKPMFKDWHEVIETET